MKLLQLSRQKTSSQSQGTRHASAQTPKHVSKLHTLSTIRIAALACPAVPPAALLFVV